MGTLDLCLCSTLCLCFTFVFYFVSVFYFVFYFGLCFTFLSKVHKKGEKTYLSYDRLGYDFFEEVVRFHAGHVLV